jgi:hypothetical protein
MARSRIIQYLFLAACIFVSISFSQGEWGFFGHRLINRMAVFTLPPELMVLYKANIEYLTEHAVDADKRRYAAKQEAIRHYIDLDHWGAYPFENLPRKWDEALLKYTQVWWMWPTDTVILKEQTIWEAWKNEVDKITIKNGLEINVLEYVQFFKNMVLPKYYEEEWIFTREELKPLLNQKDTLSLKGIAVVDRFSEHGIVPYYLPVMKYNLVQAFKEKDNKRILRLSADLGHYIGDAHVPLHTTENYNGQFTDQIGIHAFWESRLPELFAEKEYDFLVGKADYIHDADNFFWDMVFSSHAYVDSVLVIEKELSRLFPSDQQYCYEDRLNLTVRTYCAEYARAYHQRLQGQVERRMRSSIHSIGSMWYTCWVDAGQPDFGDINLEWSPQELAEFEELEVMRQKGTIKGRSHN